MIKKFNITGTCYPHLHYMMDNSAKLAGALKMIEQEEYFTINRPRQFGKTTMLFLLQETLGKMEGYMPIRLNFQGIDEKWHEADDAFATMFMNQLHQALLYTNPDIAVFVKELAAEVQDMDTLSIAITKLVHRADKKLVLLIDEVDVSSNFLPFLNFLGMLRTKYLDRYSPQHATFHSIVLAGVHDIKSLKAKFRPDGMAQYNSPWNIATDFEVEMTFNPTEIAPMLVEYSKAEGMEMDVLALSEKLYYYTSGYPFLVSKLCKTIAEKITPYKAEKNWDFEDLEKAVNLVLKENNSNFDSLIKNLENSEDLYNMAFQIIINGTEVPFDPYEPIASSGRLYGVFKQNGRLKIHNRIYEQILYNYMTAKTFAALLKKDLYDFPTTFFINADNTLNVENILVKFQQFMKEQYSLRDEKFLERQWRLLFLSFLKPIINGKGHDFKEVEISEEKRLDIVVTFLEHKYIIELKIWRGEKGHKKGLDQLADYLDRQHQQKGYLLIFDKAEKKTWQKKNIKHGGKEIFAAWA